MFEKFTDRARKVMAFSNLEAQRFNHEYIGTEHILLGLVREGSGTAVSVLQDLHIDLHTIRKEVEQLIKSGPNAVTVGRVPQTGRAKKVIEFAIEEARQLGHSHVGTEHLLLGLLREEEGIAAQVLRHLGLNVEEARRQMAAHARDLTGIAPDEKHKKAKQRHSTCLLFLHLLNAEDGMISRALSKHGIDPAAVEKVIRKLDDEISDDLPPEIPFKEGGPLGPT